MARDEKLPAFQRSQDEAPLQCARPTIDKLQPVIAIKRPKGEPPDENRVCECRSWEGGRDRSLCDFACGPIEAALENGELAGADGSDDLHGTPAPFGAGAAAGWVAGLMHSGQVSWIPRSKDLRGLPL